MASKDPLSVPARRREGISLFLEKGGQRATPTFRPPHTAPLHQAIRFLHNEIGLSSSSVPLAPGRVTGKAQEEIVEKGATRLLPVRKKVMDAYLSWGERVGSFSANSSISKHQLRGKGSACRVAMPNCSSLFLAVANRRHRASTSRRSASPFRIAMTCIWAQSAAIGGWAIRITIQVAKKDDAIQTSASRSSGTLLTKSSLDPLM